MLDPKEYEEFKKELVGKAAVPGKYVIKQNSVTQKWTVHEYLVRVWPQNYREYKTFADDHNFEFSVHVITPFISEKEWDTKEDAENFLKRCLDPKEYVYDENGILIDSTDNK